MTYSVVDVDGGSAASGASGPSDQPATVYHTVTKSADVEEPEATTVSVSVTIIETKHASATSTDVSSSSSSTSSSASSLEASAQASSSASSPSATATTTLDALSVLESAKSTFQTRPISVVSTPAAKPSTTQAPSVAPESQASHTDSESECEASSVTVTAEVTDAEETVTATQVSTKGQTVVLFSTTTVTPLAASTSYYDDGMWHTRYAIKPAASPEPVSPASKDDDAAPKFEKPSKPDEDKPAHDHNNVASKTTSQAANGTYHARREVVTGAPTPTIPATPSGNAAESGEAPVMLIQPLLPQSTSTAAPQAALAGDAAASPDVLSASDDIAPVAKRTATYNVVSWNETSEA